MLSTSACSCLASAWISSWHPESEVSSSGPEPRTSKDTRDTDTHKGILNLHHKLEARPWCQTSKIIFHPTEIWAARSHQTSTCALLSHPAWSRECAQLKHRESCSVLFVSHDLGLPVFVACENHICFVQKACLQCINPGSCKIPTAAGKGTGSSAAGDCLISL